MVEVLKTLTDRPVVDAPMDSSGRVVVVGAGLGGLACAIRLRRAGREVLVLEQGDAAGGKAGVLHEGGYRFDTGPSLLTMKGVYDDLVAAAGYDPESVLPCHRLEVSCRYWYPDRTTIDAYTERERLAEEIAQKTADTAEAVRKFSQYARKIDERTRQVYVEKPISWRTLLSPTFWRSTLAIREVDPFRTMNQAIEAAFRDEKTRNIFRRFATYNGSDPYQAPATLNVISGVEQEGVWLPQGGIQAIPESLYRIAKELGVVFRFGSPVTALEGDGKRITKVVTDREVFPVDELVSNVDVFTMQRWLPEREFPAPKAEEMATTTLVWYWGVRRQHPSLAIHNIFFPEDYPAEFRSLWEERVPGEAPTVYVNLTSPLNPDDAPPGCENWFVMLNLPVGYELTEERIGQLRRKTLDTLERHLGDDLESAIEVEHRMTPKDCEAQTGSFRGSLYGRHSNGRFSAFLRPAAKSRMYENLTYCGGTTHPGGGMPLALVSGKFAAEAVLTNHV